MIVDSLFFFALQTKNKVYKLAKQNQKPHPSFSFTLPLRLQLEQLGKCRFMDRGEFSDGVNKLKAAIGETQAREAS